jgi:hypothetical protein
MAKVIRLFDETGTRESWLFECPGCGYGHAPHTRGARQLWTFNGDEERPTFHPSILVFQSEPSRRCHSFVRDGQIQFLDDCFHALKGQTVPLPDVDE